MPNLASKEYCTGCTSCASVCPRSCITMAPDSAGFQFPVVDETACVRCGLCEQACPVVTPLKTGSQTPEAYAAYSRDEHIRMDSSSGGVFSELARAVLSQGGAVYGAAYNESFEVVHICVEEEPALHKLRGSKYAQSNLHAVFPEVKRKLESGQTVLFSGTPCQVGGLNAYLRKAYDNLLTVDFVCHSVPSPMVWQEYIKYRSAVDNEGAPPVTINLRSKISGWSNYCYSNLFDYGNGRCHTVRSGTSLYMKLFGGGYINREACASCKFKGYSRVSDLTIGDFWGIWEIAPDMDDNKGTSVILVQSEKGADWLQRICTQLVLKAVTPEQASQQNPAMIRTSKPNPRRAEALELIRFGKIADCEAWFPAPPKNGAQARPSILKRIYRKMKRLVK